MYRPFTKKWLYFNTDLIESPSIIDKIWGHKNISISTSGNGSSKGFSSLATNCYTDLQALMNSNIFPLYDNSTDSDVSLFSSINKSSINVSKMFIDKIDLSFDNAFYYLYGVMNSSGYLINYHNDLLKDIPRIPILKNKMKYVEIGKKLMDLHLNYEEVPTYKNVNIENNSNNYVVNKMKFAKVRDENGKLVKDKSTIIFNDDITIRNIPSKAYEYVINGRSAIEWIMDQYQVKTDKKSGITDDPNEYSDDPKYIFNLLLRIINVSLQTVDLVNQLPKFEIDE